MSEQKKKVGPKLASKVPAKTTSGKVIEVDIYFPELRPSRPGDAFAWDLAKAREAAEAEQKAERDRKRAKMRQLQPLGIKARKARYPSNEQLAASWQRWANEYGQHHRHTMKIEAVAAEFYEHPALYVCSEQRPFSIKTLTRKLKEIHANMKRAHKRPRKQTIRR